MARNIVITAHKFLTQPDDDLVEFLNAQEKDKVLHILHSFQDAQDRKSIGRLYKKGKMLKESVSADFANFKSTEPVIYLKELMFTFKTVFVSGRLWDVYIGMDGLCVLFGLILKRFLKVRKVIYWAIDFVPEGRFDSDWKNFVYRWVNNFGLRNADEVWDLSPRMVEARKKFAGFKLDEYKTHKVVPYGAWTKRIKKYTFDECDRHTLVFMGHLIPKQGVQLVIQAIPEIIKSVPELKFKIIGDGVYKKELENLARNLGVERFCDFRGKIDDHRVLEDEIAKSCLAIAPYVESLDTWTRYADPGKVKTYLACGVPVLLTNLPWNTLEIVSAGCGSIITENSESISKQVLRYMEPKVNQESRNSALVYSREFDYEKIFSRLNL